ncbi:MAG: hypothetical protein JHC84_18085 [Solirubrobacteraceae bacterium]|nr:hypothetical protein [Solirubrobacteraceae bacterium]
MTTFPTARVAAGAAAVASAAFLVNAAIQVASPTFDPQISGTRDWANEITFTLAVAGALVGVLGLARSAIIERRPAHVAAFGFTLLLVGLLAGFPTAESPEWFAAVGAPGNALCLIGLGWAAVGAWRSETVPRAAIPLMPLSVLLGVGAAEVGGGLVAAAWWGCAAVLLTRVRVAVA